MMPYQMATTAKVAPAFMPTFADLGLELNRNTMVNWVINTSKMLHLFWQVMKVIGKF